MGLGPLTHQVGPPDVPPDSSPPHLSVGPACFSSLPLLPASTWLLVHILSFRDSVQLVLRLLSDSGSLIFCGRARRQAQCLPSLPSCP